MGNISPEKVVAFAGPFIALAAGTVAAWLFLHFPGLGHYVDADTVAGQLATAGVFVATTAVSAVLKLKWLQGAQQWNGYIADPHSDVNADGSPGAVFHPSDDPWEDSDGVKAPEAH